MLIRYLSERARVRFSHRQKKPLQHESPYLAVNTKQIKHTNTHRKCIMASSNANIKQTDEKFMCREMYVYTCTPTGRTKEIWFAFGRWIVPKRVRHKQNEKRNRRSHTAEPARNVKCLFSVFRSIGFNYNATKLLSSMLVKCLAHPLLRHSLTMVCDGSVP